MCVLSPLGALPSAAVALGPLRGQRDGSCVGVRVAPLLVGKVPHVTSPCRSCACAWRALVLSRVRGREAHCVCFMFRPIGPSSTSPEDYTSRPSLRRGFYLEPARSFGCWGILEGRPVWPEFESGAPGWCMSPIRIRHGHPLSSLGHPCARRHAGALGRAPHPVCVPTHPSLFTVLRVSRTLSRCCPPVCASVRLGGSDAVR